MENQIIDAFGAKAEHQVQPIKYLMQTLDDAALVLTVCRMALHELKEMSLEEINETEKRVQTVKDLLEAIDISVAQYYNHPIIVDSSIKEI